MFRHLMTTGIPSNAPRVLIVDDDPEICQSAGILLNFNGYAVSAAKSGSEALALLASQPVQAILLDLVLPDMEDTELFARLRMLQPGVPIIICTGREFAHIDQGILHEPQVSYLEKPYTCSALCAAIAGAICAKIL